MSKLIPYEIDGWKRQGDDRTYDRDTIFDYMNGAGEIYRSYRFHRLLVREFAKAHQPKIVVELFDMGSSENAFGVFTHGCELGREDIGQGSEYRDGLLCFWKDKFFICVYSEEETIPSKNAVLGVGRAIATSIKTTGRSPRLLEYLPTEGLIKNTIRYFYLHTSLNYHYFVADQNILNLNLHTKAVLAQYQREGDKVHLLCVQYKDREEAEDSFERFVKIYLPESNKSVGQTEDGNWTKAEVHQELVIVVFDAPTREYAESLIRAVREKLESL